jgi:hypothetical protein
LLKILVLMAVCGLLFVAACVIAGVYIFNSIGEGGPEPISTLGQTTVVKETPNGWSIYDFKDIGVRMDLPAKPEVFEPDWEFGDKMIYSYYAMYALESEHVTVNIQRLWFRWRETEPYPTLREQDRQRAEAYLSGYTLQSSFDNPSIDGVVAHRGKHAYSEPDIDSHCMFESIFIWDPNWIMILDLNYDPTDKAGVAQRDRIVKSISWKANAKPMLSNQY